AGRERHPAPPRPYRLRRAVPKSDLEISRPNRAGDVNTPLSTTCPTSDSSSFGGRVRRAG
ncbi:hypothetical protein ACFU51_31025, partial [Streptomyces sp. NPDC057430]|uniref:hypothetical protein n=1 Tax=Streptomyces sp. NPDC057430 TaxID=3346131 RepID=UPI0036BA07B8